jgi:signal transduction histidine kinase
MKFHLVDNEGSVLATNLSSEELKTFATCEVSNEIITVRDKRYRHGKVINELGVTYIVTDNEDQLSRRRYFKEVLYAHTTLLRTLVGLRSRISQETVKRGRRLLHNVEELNGANISEVFSLVPEESLRKTTPLQQREVIKKTLAQKADAVAKSVQKIIKNNAAIRNEISVFEKLEGSTPVIKRQIHNLRRALLNILHIFYEDFNVKSVKVHTGESETLIELDYEALHVAFYHLFENATKYVWPDSDILISFEEDVQSVTVNMSMISMEMKPEEMPHIYTEGFSGFFPKKSGQSGKGIGMAVVKKVLPINQGKLEIIPDADSSVSLHAEGIHYVRNVFKIHFRK